MDESRKPIETENAPEPQPRARKSPPKIYYAACGALCDVFWWARRSDESGSAEE